MTEVLGDTRPELTAASISSKQDPFLVVENLTVQFPTHDGLVQAVTDLSYAVELGETLGIVGESGSGKSVSSMAVLGLHDVKRSRLTGSIRVGGQEVIGASEATLRRIRGNDVAMIFQDPLTALHPFFTMGAQIVEAYRLHNKVSKQVAWKRAVEMLDLVGIPEPQRRVKDYLHQFSGGMRQRAMIAMSLVNDPKLLIADEPTTALDVTVQAQILDLMQAMQKEFGSAIIIITHDLGVVAEVADDILVMYAGKSVEYGSVEDIFYRPEHPYAWGLLNSVTRLDRLRQDRLQPIAGSPPSLINVPTGCAFHPRCPYCPLTNGLGEREYPPLREATPGHLVACHLPHEERERIWSEEISPKL